MAKKKTIAPSAQRLIKMLNDRILDEHDTIPGSEDNEDVVPAVMMVVPGGGGYGPDGIMFRNGKVLFCHHGRRQTIRGVVDGFNVYALDAARVLEAFGLVTQVAVEAFSDWYFATSAAKAEADERSRLRSSAADLGYTLVKNKRVLVKNKRGSRKKPLDG